MAPTTNDPPRPHTPPNAEERLRRSSIHFLAVTVRRLLADKVSKPMLMCEQQIGATTQAPVHAEFTATSLLRFDSVLNEERKFIQRRRLVSQASAHPPRPPAMGIALPTPSATPAANNTTGTPDDLSGLALSGGGIRSATYCLGLLQGLNARNLLRNFDYLSTVSGGGFVGGWWSAWLSRRDDDGPQPLSSIFPPPERIEPQVAHTFVPLRVVGAKVHPEGPQPEPAPDAAINAGVDPIHHLRLFSNYLTPRTGLLSNDSWRAGTVISRNLLFNWVALVPVLGMCVAVAMLAFSSTQGADSAGARAFFCDWDGPCYSLIGAQSRFNVIWHAFIPFMVAYASLSVLWLFHGYGIGPWAFGSLLASFAAVLLVPILLLLGNVYGWTTPVPAVTSIMNGWTLSHGHVALAIGAVISELFVIAFGVMPLVDAILLATSAGAMFPRSIANFRLRTLSITQPGVLRTSISQLQTSVTTLGALVVAVLVVVGFSGDVVHYFTHSSSQVALFLKGTAGVIASLVALMGGAGLALADNSGKGAGVGRRIVIAIAPSAFLLALTIGLGAALRAWLFSVPPDQKNLPGFEAAIIIASAVALGFAANELLTDDDGPRFTPLGAFVFLVLPGVVAGIGGIIAGLRASSDIDADNHYLTMLCGATLGWVLARFLLPREDGVSYSWRERSMTYVAAVLGAVLGGVGPHFFNVADRLCGEGPVAVLGGFLIAIGFCMAVFENFSTTRGSNHAIALITWATTGLLAMLLLETFGHPAMPMHLGRIEQTIAVVYGLSAAVIFFGWQADPNQLGLHGFYSARIARAYLGASNRTRSTRRHEITDAVTGDDMPLADLRNCERGAPFHIINTTLNLVGSDDLATAQRSSANFTLSQAYCGSGRTGYRYTGEYMSGELTLSASVAASGAAVSPNMGSKSVSGAVSALMAFFNVRLGFWAPTPNKTRWQSSHPRLWPFYLIREALSQTTALGPYCYLTDGGHFDNTGAYALIQRGCRFIVVVDCGADPGPSYSDMGDLIRRCRVDFGAEVTFPAEPSAPSYGFATDPRQRVMQHRAGTIRYSAAHLESLGLPQQRVDGTIIWVKPQVTRDVPLDIVQYSLDANGFPQQPTTDQWFDEAQFESYRQLGYEGARTIAPDFTPGSALDSTAFFLAAGGLQPPGDFRPPPDQPIA